MKRGACLLLLFAASAAAGARETSIGDYAEAVRSRIVGKVREALGAGGKKVEVSGVVTFAAGDRFFIQKGDDGLKVLPSGRLPAVGDDVTVTGEPSLEGGRIVFAAAKWRRNGQGEVPPARAASSADLVDGETRTGVNALRVVVSGRAIGRTESGFAMNVDNTPVNVMTESLPDFMEDCDRLHPQVKVTGVAELMLDQSVLLGRDGYVIGVKVNVVSPADIVLVPDVSYLAAKHDRQVRVYGMSLLVALAAGLLVFLVVIFRQRRGLFRTRTIMAERKRMADDIHDTIEQHLVGAGMLLKINRVAEAQEVLVRAKREIRDIVWGLKNDDMMRLSPAELLRKLAHDENTKGLYRVDTRLDGLPAKMDAASMRDLSLVVREAIGNAVKHGGAKKIAISADTLADGGWRMRISNDGAPFDPATAPGAKEGHFGLEGMRQRARRIGVSISFEHRGKGMVVVLEKKNMV